MTLVMTNIQISLIPFNGNKKGRLLDKFLENNYDFLIFLLINKYQIKRIYYHEQY